MRWTHPPETACREGREWFDDLDEVVRIRGMPRERRVTQRTMGRARQAFWLSICGLIAACEPYVCVRFGRGWDGMGGGPELTMVLRSCRWPGPERWAPSQVVGKSQSPWKETKTQREGKCGWRERGLAGLGLVWSVVTWEVWVGGTANRAGRTRLLGHPKVPFTVHYPLTHSLMSRCAGQSPARPGWRMARHCMRSRLPGRSFSPSCFSILLFIFLSLSCSIPRSWL